MTHAPEWIERRMRQLALGRKVIASGIALWLATVAWLVWRYPLMTNPLHLLRQLEQNALDPTTLSVLAMLTPLLFALVGLLMLFLLMLGLGSLTQEARLLTLLRERRPD
ncbi:MAG: hypothetical protein ACOZAQ_10570 [Pseudomonadota bacterium]